MTTTPEQRIGAACMLCYLRDLFTATPRETFTRESILVILEAVSRDPELFSENEGVKAWSLE